MDVRRGYERSTESDTPTIKRRYEAIYRLTNLFVLQSLVVVKQLLARRTSICRLQRLAQPKRKSVLKTALMVLTIMTIKLPKRRSRQEGRRTNQQHSLSLYIN
ncbi:unnamed protein product [Ceratitis capitata]|uniref:(Mediterranean fruit fly) hypothetical protein n=1 Tax=Ceratitis capitata TaxID=7213 RepID=A0A811UD82_CERCA|nr:unnamed protein product [Ceratitis capitata]